MKKRVINARSLKQAALAVPAAALMLGAAEAGTTVGLNFQAWYYDSGTAPQTVGFGNGYQTTGFPVTAKAFGVDVADWTNSDPLDCNGAFFAFVPFGGTLSASVTAANMWQSGYTTPGVWGTPLGDWYAAWPAGSYVQSVMEPGDYEVTWGMVDNTGWTIDLSGMAAIFPDGYVLELIGSAKTKATSVVEITNTFDYTALASVTFTVLPDGMGLGTSPVLTNDMIQLYNDSRSVSSTRNCALGGLIITDKPVVSQKPVGGSYNAGATISLSASAVGIPPLSYQWQHAGTNLPGATTTSYVKAGAGPEDAGDYTLVATNPYGAGTSAVASVTVVMTPTISADISSGSTYETLSHRFSVTAGGQQPLSYQWLHEGTNLPGATASSLLLNDLQTADAGTYQVIVTNTLGAATSSVATLTLVAGLPYEGFAYADGDLGGQNGGTGWGDAWTAPWTSGSNAVYSPDSAYKDADNDLVTTGSRLLTGVFGQADFGNDRSLAANIGGAGSVYISFIGGFTNGGWQGIRLLQDDASACFLGQGWYNSPWGCGSFPYPEVLSGKPSTVESFVVYRFDFAETNTQVKVYVNPTLAVEPATADATGALNLFTFNKVRVMAHALNAGVVDELRIGGTWESVTPNVPRTDPPVIVRDLSGITAYAYAGGNATLSILADGAPTLHYQWKKGATPVGSDSATLELTSVTTADTGDYYVTVSNAYGTTNSVTNHLTVVASPDVYTSKIATDAPVGYWPLNETAFPTAFDYAGGNHGTQNGNLTLGVAGPRPPAYQGFSSGKVAYEFDGFSSYVDCGTGPSLSGTTDFTLEAWVKTTNNAGAYVLQQRSGFNGEYVLRLDGRGRVFFLIYGGGGYQYEFGSPIAGPRVNDGRWHHIAAVRSGTDGGIYIDGSLVATSTGTLRPLDPTFPVAIGKDLRDGANFFQGLISDVAIYNYALPAASIADHAYTGVLASSPLVLTLAQGGWVEDSKPVGTPYDGKNLGVSWVDSVTDINFTPVTRNGVARFSSGAQIAIPANDDFNSPSGTICFWMLATSPILGPGSEGAMLFDRRTTQGAVIVLNDSGSIFWQGQSGAQNSFAAGYVPDGNWHHVAVTYGQTTSDTLAIYVDGMLNGSVPVTNGWSWGATQQIELGRSHSTYWKEYQGLMDDFRIYNRILTDTEIATIAAPATSDDLVDTAALKVRYNFGTAAGVGTQLTWPIGVLQTSPTVGPAVWTPISTTTLSYPWWPPYGMTNAAAFYRVQM